jgi:hypothetical protein
MNAAALIVLSIAAAGGVAALAQSEAAVQERAAASSRRDTPEEVIVRGRQIGELRVEVQTARELAYAIFNEINSNDDFDVLCRDETRYFSHAKRRVCRARFEGRISSQAAKEYMNTLAARCQPDGEGAIQWQACMFSSVGQSAKANAQAVEGQAPGMHDRMNDEILRLARTDLRFGQAILDFFEASQQYDAARERRED